jgi:hypothetical protein
MSEHHLLPFPLGPPVVVNTIEPSSIIAYALSSTEYNRKLAEGRGITNLDVPMARSDSKSALRWY